MHYLILCLPLFFLPALASGQSTNTCNDPEINQKWERAAADQPQNRLVKKLLAKRIELCKLVKSGQLDSKTARSIWEKTLTDSFLERTQEEQPRPQEKQERRGLLVLFANFIF